MERAPLFKKLPHSIDHLRGKWVFVGDAFLGDNGKGKISLFVCYYLKENGLEVALAFRPNGINNAGHGAFAPWGPYGPQENYTCNVVPMGIVYGIPSLIGAGAGVHPIDLFLRELKNLADKNVDIEKVLVSHHTHIVLQHYFAIEQIQEIMKGDKKVGTTKKAVGVNYEFQKNRFGIRVCDLQNMAECKKKVKRNYDYARLTLDGYNTYRLASERVAVPTFDEVWDSLSSYADRLLKMARDEQELFQSIREKGQVGVAEMGQGTYLDNLHGDYPFVTASGTTIPGGLWQAGLSTKDLGYSILVVKGPYWTRVGEGNFPTEFSPDEAEKFRQIGHEFGTTTGRPRRCGYPDLPLLHKAITLNGADCLCLTKMDAVPEAVDFLKVRDVSGNENTIRCWRKEDAAGETSLTDLPESAQVMTWHYEQAGTKASLISTGPSLEHMIISDSFLKKP